MYKSGGQGTGLSGRCKAAGNWHIGGILSHETDWYHQESGDEEEKYPYDWALDTPKFRRCRSVKEKQRKLRKDSQRGRRKAWRVESWRLIEESLTRKDEGQLSNAPDGSSEMKTEKWSLNVATGRSLRPLEQFWWDGGGRCHIRVCLRENGRTWIEGHAYRQNFWRYFYKGRQRMRGRSEYEVKGFPCFTLFL